MFLVDTGTNIADYILLLSVVKIFENTHNERIAYPNCLVVVLLIGHSKQYDLKNHFQKEKKKQN